MGETGTERNTYRYGGRNRSLRFRRLRRLGQLFGMDERLGSRLLLRQRRQHFDNDPGPANSRRVDLRRFIFVIRTPFGIVGEVMSLQPFFIGPYENAITSKRFFRSLTTFSPTTQVSTILGVYNSAVKRGKKRESSVITT